MSKPDLKSFMRAFSDEEIKSWLPDAEKDEVISALKEAYAHIDKLEYNATRRNEFIDAQQRGLNTQQSAIAERDALIREAIELMKYLYDEDNPLVALSGKAFIAKAKGVVGNE